MNKNLKAKITRVPVNSSNIQEIGFDNATSTLEIMFYPKRTGGISPVWRYWPVTEETYEEMKSAESVGSYFSKNIRFNPNLKSQFVD